MNQIKSDDTVISPCVGRLLVSVLLTPSLTPDFFFFFVHWPGPIGTNRFREKSKRFQAFWINFSLESGDLKSPQPQYKEISCAQVPKLVIALEIGHIL